VFSYIANGIEKHKAIKEKDLPISKISLQPTNPISRDIFIKYKQSNN
jgi:hypothetical protein